jgi:hypothetical protein
MTGLCQGPKVSSVLPDKALKLTRRIFVTCGQHQGRAVLRQSARLHQRSEARFLLVVYLSLIGLTSRVSGPPGSG